MKYVLQVADGVFLDSTNNVTTDISKARFFGTWQAAKNHATDGETVLMVGLLMED